MSFMLVCFASRRRHTRSDRDWGSDVCSSDLASRLLKLDLELTDLMLEYRPDAAAVEEVFVNSNPQSTLKLGQARGVVLLGASRTGIEIGEYAARSVKK